MEKKKLEKIDGGLGFKLSDRELLNFKKSGHKEGDSVNVKLSKVDDFMDDDRIDSFTKFTKFYTTHIDKHFSNIGVFKREAYVKTFKSLFAHGRVFEIDKQLQEEFKNTKNKFHKRMKPLNIPIFIPCNIKLHNIKVYALVLFEGGSDDFYILATNGINIARFNTPIRSLKSLTIEEIKSDNFLGYQDKYEKELYSETRNYVWNFLDFLNHPEIKTRLIKSINNEKRKSRGQLPMPDKVFVTVTGKLYKYLYEDRVNVVRNSINCRFWVRGHFVHFHNKKRYKRLYLMGQDKLDKGSYYLNDNIITKYICGYIKGSGEMKNKIYRLRKN